MKTASAVLVLVFAFAMGTLPIVYAQQHRAAAPRTISASGCAAAQSLRLAKGAVTGASVVAAGQFAPPQGSAAGYADLPAFCRVLLTLRPSADSDIRSELWLPLSGWNGKFQEVGNGAWGGSVQYGPLADALRRGYAAASTDTGHTGSDASFAMGHPEKLLDFGYRAIHETAIKSKSIIESLYHAPADFSYFTGCSGGGRQAFMEAQRFPEDFDAILAGAPGYDRTNQSFQLVAVAQATHLNPESFIPKEKLPALHKAALYACDALDGVADGLISDPMRCQFDPAIIQCTGADTANCLTAPQVAAARKLYSAIKDPRTGQEIFPGYEPGSELQWVNTATTPRPLGMSDDLFKFVVFKDPSWDFRTLDLSKHLELARKIDGGNISAASADISRFINRGGKLIIYHGWADPNISPRSSVRYYQRLAGTLGGPPVENSVRLYMVPGMGHCGGGDGPNQFDLLTALENWREHGQAPGEVIAAKLENGKTVRTRPLCPFPQLARYKGAGSIDDAKNFACQAVN